LAKADIGPKISVEGEQQYRQQMKNIIAQQKEYASELALATASLSKNATAQERAGAVTGILKKQIENQKQAIAATSEQLKRAAAQYEEGDAKLSNYRTAINKSSTELQNLKNRLQDAENGMGEFAEKTVDATSSLKNIPAKTSFFDSIAGQVTKGMTLANAFSKVSDAIKNIAVQSVKTGVSYNAQMEQYQVALTNMLGSQTQAVDTLEKIKEDAARTPFDTAGLVKANELLISAGVSAEDSRQTILALGDAVSATGGGNEELSRMAQNLQQIKNAGEATSADIKQFAYAGIDVYGILADYTGKSTAEVQNMKISYELLTSALQAAAEEGGRYYDSMNTQSETMNGKLSTLKDNATQLAGVITSDLADGVKIVIGNLNDMTTAATEAYKKDGWVGLAASILGCKEPLDTLTSSVKKFGENAVYWLDKASYSVNKFLGKNAYEKYGSYEEYRKEADKKNQVDEHRQEILEKMQKGELGEKQYDRLHPKTPVTTVEPDGSTTSTSVPSAATKQAVADVNKLVDTMKATNTELVEGNENVVGAIKKTTETTTNTYQILDGKTGKLKDTTKETAKVVTSTWTEMVDGIATNFKKIEKMENGAVTSTQVTSEAAEPKTTKSTLNKTEHLKGGKDIRGDIEQTTQTVQEKARVLNETTGQYEEQIIGTTQVITRSYKKIIDGHESLVTETNKIMADGTEELSTVTDVLDGDITYTNGLLGSFSGFIYDLDNKIGGLDKAAQSLKKSPLGSWFSDMAKGYRAWDSFWDNVDVGSLITNGLVAFATGYMNTQNGGLANGLQTMMLSVMSNLVGVNLSSLQGLGSTWGGDLVKGMASGMVTVAAKAGWLTKAAKFVGSVIRAFLHFSRPDKGPLRDYETWMPDMVHGMADSLKNNAYVLRNAARDVSSDLQTQMQYDVGMASPSYEQNYKSSTVKLGGVTMTIQAQPGMDEEKLAQYTIDRLNQMINEEAASSGQIPVF
jgi:phage tape measure protein